MTSDPEIRELDAVALLADIPTKKLSRGHVGTVVHILDKDTLLVEFSNNTGAAYAIEAVQKEHLLPLIQKMHAPDSRTVFHPLAQLAKIA